VVTGSARGIGKAIAQRYAALGASVVVNYSGDEQNAQRTVQEIETARGRAVAVRADVSCLTDLDRLFTTAIDTFGSLTSSSPTPARRSSGSRPSRPPRSSSTACSRSTPRAPSHPAEGGEAVLRRRTSDQHRIQHLRQPEPRSRALLLE
jgi:hypothetical protein